MSTSKSADKPATKKRKFGEPDQPSSSQVLQLTLGEPRDARAIRQEADVDEELIERPLARLSTVSNPAYLQRLEAAGILAFERAEADRFTSARYYNIRVVNLRAAMTTVLSEYMRWKYAELGRLTIAQITAEITKVVPLAVDACMAALYAKLRTIHKQYATYASRYSTPPTYNKDLELPLPFADIIQNFGVFETRGLKKNYVMVPTYPEGTRHEGRSTELFMANDYETATTYLKMHGIPLKSVDTRSKFGSAWWTYQVSDHDGVFDLDCILPQPHYTGHSAICAMMFMNKNAADEIVPIIEYKEDDVHYGTRARELRFDMRRRAFSALCHAPSIEWDYYSSEL